MRISEKRHGELYGSIHNPIMDLRVKFTMAGKLDNHLDIDKELYELVEKIHAGMSSALDLHRG